MADRLERLLDDIDHDADFRARTARDPLSTLRDYATRRPPYSRDPWIYRCGMLFLGTSVVIALLGCLWLAYTKSDVPQAALVLGGTAMGALGGVFGRNG